MYIMNNYSNDVYYSILLYTIIVILFYKLYLNICSKKKNIKEKMIDSIYNRNSLELIGKYCNVNVLRTLRDNCDPRLFNFLKYNNQSYDPYSSPNNIYSLNPYINQYINPYTNPYTNPYIYQQTYDNDYVFHNVGFLYKKDSNEKKNNDPFYMLPLYAKEYKGGIFEYMTRVNIGGNKFEIPIYKNKKINSLKSREIYDGDEIEIGNPINNIYIYSQTK